MISEIADIIQRELGITMRGREACERAASAIEARRAETAQHGSVADESAVPQGDARD